MDDKWKISLHIDQKIKSIAQRNLQLSEEYEALKMANKEVLSKTSTDQVS
tara:strand:- start:470 stop:619 length:150 start_codon:yes stop_codon:yes gene_type:complete